MQAKEIRSWGEKVEEIFLPKESNKLLYKIIIFNPEDMGEERCDSVRTEQCQVSIQSYRQRQEVAMLCWNNSSAAFFSCRPFFWATDTFKNYKFITGVWWLDWLICVLLFSPILLSIYFILAGALIHFSLNFPLQGLLLPAWAGARVNLWQLCPYLVKLCDDSAYCPSASNPDYFGGEDVPGTSHKTAAAGRHKENTPAILTFTL